MSNAEWIQGGLQQVGVGVANNQEMWDFYKNYLGFNISMFNEVGTADIMAPYMGNKSWERHARFAINLNGGGGLEIWQYTNRTPLAMPSEISLGNLGILSAHIRCKNLYEIRKQFLKDSFEVSEPCYTPDGLLRCFVRDKGYNWLCLEEHNDGWFIEPALNTKVKMTRKKLRNADKYSFFSTHCGGVCGVMIGVSQMEQSISFYKDVCGYDTVVYDSVDTFSDFNVFMGQQEVRRVKLVRSQPNRGTFAPLLTESYIELVEAKNHQEAHVYKDRYWGDIGFIHLCFDVRGMDALKEYCNSLDYPFTIDTGEEFSMENASGRFSYLEDPDGTLIEFVEVYKMPILAKLGISLNIQKRDKGSPLPKYLLKMLKLFRET